MLNIKIYDCVDSYYVDVWKGMKVIEEFRISHRNYNAVQKVKNFVNEVIDRGYPVKIDNDTGIKI